MKRTSFALASALVFVPPAAYFELSKPPTLQQVAAKAQNATVYVRAEKGEADTKEKWSGSGWLIKGGYIVTAAHVAPGKGEDIIVKFFGGKEEIKATVVGSDETLDIAVLKPARVPYGIKPLDFGDSDKIQVGDTVVESGNPLGLQWTITKGIVSALHRSAPDKDQRMDYFQFDASTNHGNSGGPLMGDGGGVIGLADSIMAPSNPFVQSGSVGLAFGIPSRQIQAAVDRILAFAPSDVADAEVAKAMQQVPQIMQKRCVAGLGCS